MTAEICYDNCVNSFRRFLLSIFVSFFFSIEIYKYSRKLEEKEMSCIKNCSEKFFKFSQRAHIRYGECIAQQQHDLMEKNV